MIVLDEALGDPVIFFQENPDLTAGLMRGQSLVVAAPDFEVCAVPHTTLLGGEHKVDVTPVSALLGDLYMHGEARRVHIGLGREISLEWFDSSLQTNNLIEQFGRQPGVNSLQAVIGNTEFFQFPVYVGGIAAGSLLQSNGNVRFFHDRSETHKVTAITMSAELGVASIATAKRAVSRKWPLREAAITKMAGVFERGTNGISALLHELHDNNGTLDLAANMLTRQAYEHAGEYLRFVGMAPAPGETVASYLRAELARIQQEVAAVRAKRSQPSPVY